VKGDKADAIRLLRSAAEIYRDQKLGMKAMKLLRHIRRLEGKDEDAPPLQVVPDPVIPFEAQLFQGPKTPRVMPDRGPMLADPKLEAWCSFCCKPSTEVGRLVAAPTGTFICIACIQAAKEMLK